MAAFSAGVAVHVSVSTGCLTPQQTHLPWDPSIPCVAICTVRSCAGSCTPHHLTKCPSRLLPKKQRPMLMIWRVETQGSIWLSGQKWGPCTSHECGKLPGYEEKEAARSTSVLCGNVCVAHPAPAHPGWTSRRGRKGISSCSFGRESRFQERYSHEPSGSQLMSPWGATASGGTEVGPWPSAYRETQQELDLFYKINSASL